MTIALLSALTRWAKTFWQAGPATGVPRRTREANCRSGSLPPNLARLHGAPDLAPHYLLREEVLIGLKRKLLSEDASVAITGQGQAGLLADYRPKSDLLIWRTRRLGQLKGSKETLTAEQKAKGALRVALKGRPALVVEMTHFHRLHRFIDSSCD
jgi:hypothetical protein